MRFSKNSTEAGSAAASPRAGNAPQAIRSSSTAGRLKSRIMSKVSP